MTKPNFRIQLLQQLFTKRQNNTIDKRQQPDEKIRTLRNLQHQNRRKCLVHLHTTIYTKLWGKKNCTVLFLQ